MILKSAKCGIIFLNEYVLGIFTLLTEMENVLIMRVDE